MKIKVLLVFCLLFFILVPSVFAVSSSFLSNAQKWYNEECKKRPERVRGEEAVLCYAFDKLNEIQIINNNQDVKINELEQRIEVLESLQPTISPTPIPTKRVFITSTSYNGNLGGLTGGDSKCQDRANDAGLGGTWKAWLSDQTTSVSSRLNHFSGPYKLINGDKIANNWNDLTDSSILLPINLSEINTIINTPFVWTNSFPNGDIRDLDLNDTCVNWSSTTGGASTGDSSRIDGGWSDYGATACTLIHPLYCIEQ